MHIDKQQLLQTLRNRGIIREPLAIGRQLPDRIDIEASAQLLESLGLTSGELDELATRSQETGGFGGFGGPGARIRRLGA